MVIQIYSYLLQKVSEVILFTATNTHETQKFKEAEAGYRLHHNIFSMGQADLVLQSSELVSAETTSPFLSDCSFYTLS